MVKITTIILLSLGLFFLIATPALAEDIDDPSFLPSLPGRVEGTGTFFEITDSEYLNVFLKSSEEITVAAFESAPKTVSLHIQPLKSVRPTILTIDSVTLTIGNLESNKTYYKFENSYKNRVEFITDENGSYSWTQDIIQSRHVWFQPEYSGTVFLPEDCSIYGTWNELTSICTLTQDMAESVEITTNNIALDCNNYSITGADIGYGIYLNNREGITIKNCTVTNFFIGIILRNSNNNTLINNIVNFNLGFGGIILGVSSNNTLTNNIANLNGFYGIALALCDDNTLVNNIANSNEPFGIFIDCSSNNILTGNTMSNNPYNFALSGESDDEYDNDIDTTNTVDSKPIYYIQNATNQVYDSSTNAGIVYCISCNNITIKDLTLTNNGRGIYFRKTDNSKIENSNLSNNGAGAVFFNSHNNILTNNLISLNSGSGIVINNCNNSEIYHNNFIDNYRRAAYLSGGTGNLFDNGYPSGGNYWSDYVGVDQFSGPNQNQPGADGIGDTFYTFTSGEDRYPFMDESGWEVPPERIFPDEAVELAKEVIGKGYGYDRPGWWPEKIKGFTKYYINDERFVELFESGQIEGLDCSGLNFWSYNRAYYNDEKIFAGERWQKKEGDWENRPLYWYGANGQWIGNVEEIEKGKLKPGDLLFFNVTYKVWNKEKKEYDIKWCTSDKCDKIIDHVAMYVGEYDINENGTIDENENDAVIHAHAGNDDMNNAGKISVSTVYGITINETTYDGLIEYYRKKTGRVEADIVFFGRVKDAKKPESKFILTSPADLIITDPDGEMVTKEMGESPTMEYVIYDIDGDGELDDIVASPIRKIGDYLIEIVLEPDALPTDTYGLEMETLINGKIVTTVLAEDVPISEIPRTPYIIESTETEIILIISAFVDFDPDTLNLKSKGKYVIAYIELPIDYDINEINLESIKLNDQIPIESGLTEISDYDNNGIPDLMVKFNRLAVQNILEVGDEIEATITGELTDGGPFQGSDTIKVISKRKKIVILATAFLACMGIAGLFAYRRRPKFLNNIIKTIKRINYFKDK